MSKLPAVQARDVVRVAEPIGFVLDRQRGSHAVYYHPAFFSNSVPSGVRPLRRSDSSLVR
jgi:predicted RNA binding protein YcfA (HicA-like mRNA interferase family)